MSQKMGNNFEIIAVDEQWAEDIVEHIVSLVYERGKPTTSALGIQRCHKIADIVQEKCHALTKKDIAQMIKKRS